MTEGVTVTSTPAPGATAPAATPSPTAPAAPPQRFEDGGHAAQPSGGDVAALSPTQQAAKAEMDRLRPLTLKDPQAHRQFKEASEHVYGNSPAPAWLNPAKPAEPNRLIDPAGFNSEELAPAYEAAHSPEVYKTTGHNLPADLLTDPENARAMTDGLAQWAHTLKLPKLVGDIFIQRVVEHANVARQVGETSTYIGNDDITEFRQVADEALAHMGGFEKANGLARKYVESVLTPAQLKEFDALISRPDGTISSLAFDPLVIQKLATLAQARGLK